MQASLVNMQGGQCVMCSLSWVTKAGGRETVDVFSLACVDPANGDDLDRPPHGIASPLALQHAPTVILATVQRVMDRGFDVVSLTAGQGLVERAASLEAFFADVGLGFMVIPSLVTAASEDELTRALLGARLGD